MYSLATLATEIQQAVSDLETHNGSSIISKRWLTSAVLAQHEAEMAAPFATCCGRYTVEQAVDRYFRELRAAEQSAEADPQALLPGFARLQQRYLTKRDGEMQAVPVHQLSDAELRAKAAELRVMGDGLHRHADELLRFIQTRRERRRSAPCA